MFRHFGCGFAALCLCVKTGLGRISVFKGVTGPRKPLALKGFH
jgi:hypothetical protein